MVEQKNQLSMEQRINDLLRGKSIEPVHEESIEEAIQAVVHELERAEHELKVAQCRVDRLKGELEKITGKKTQLQA